MASELSKFTTNYPVDVKRVKSYFYPVQAGSGDPSLTNIRPIQQQSIIKVNHSGKNMVHVVGFSATSTSSPISSRSTTNRYGTTIDTTTYDTSNTAVTILQANYDNTLSPSHYKNGYFVVVIDNMVFDSRYNISFRITNITSNPGNIALSDIKIANPWGSTFSPTKVVGDKLFFYNVLYRRSSNNYNEQDWCVYCSGMSFTLSEFMVTPAGDEDANFEPYQGHIYNLSLPAFGKNLINTNVQFMTPDNTTGSNTTKRLFIPNTFCSGVSYSNYYNTSAVNSYSIEYNKITVNSKSGYGIGFAVSVEPSTTYYLSATYDSNGMINAALYETDGTFVSLSNGGAVTRFTTTANTNIALIILRSYNNNTDATFTNIQLEEGSSGTTYESYDSAYQGYMDLITGDVVATHKLVHVDKNITDTWVKSSHSNTDLTRWSVSMPSSDKSSYPNVMCDKFKPVNTWQPGLYETSINDNGRCVITVPATISTKELLFDFLDEIGGFDFLYPISPYIHATIPGQSIKAYIGKNRMWSDPEIDVACNVPYNPMMARRHYLLAQPPEEEEAE